ncbi:unnamed protein product [Symbiodinium sp. CCMP2592]|nr:unnamed protein product [Symbiodinium sp. CCMP2592]
MTSWKCTCGQMCRVTAEYCQKCGTHWKRACGSHYTRTEPENARPWRAPSPRRPKSPRQRGQGNKPKGPGPAGKGDSKGKQAGQVPAPPPAAPRMEQLPVPPSMTTPTGPKKGASDGAAISAERAQLDALVASLSGSVASLPESTQVLLSELQQNSTQHTARTLHRAVTDQSRARQELGKLRSARIAYLQAWQEYVKQVSDLLAQQISDQGKALDNFNQTELEWLAAEQQATQSLSRLTAADGNTDAADQNMLDSEDLVSAQAEAEARMATEKQQQQLSVQQMQTALQTAMAQASQQLSVHKREGSRTPRRKGEPIEVEEQEDADKNKPGTAATPFKLGPNASQQQPTTYHMSVDGPEHALRSLLPGELATAPAQHYDLLARQTVKVFQVGSRLTADLPRPPLHAKGGTLSDPSVHLRPPPGLLPHRPSCQLGFKDGSCRALATATPLQGQSRPGGFPRFTELRMQLASRVQVLPEHLDRPELRNTALASFRWTHEGRASGAVADESFRDRYVVFTTDAHVETKPLPLGATINEVVADLLGSRPRISSVRFLQSRLAGLPPLQVVARQREDPAGTWVTPVDLRPAQGRICTIALALPAASDLLVAQCMHTCPASRLPSQHFELALPDDTPMQALQPPPVMLEFLKGQPPAPAAATEPDDAVVLLQGPVLHAPTVQCELRKASLSAAAQLQALNQTLNSLLHDSEATPRQQARQNDPCLLPALVVEAPRARFDADGLSPTDEQRAEAADVVYIPAFVREPSTYEQPVTDHQWGLTLRGADGSYSVFDHQRHHTIERCPLFADLSTIAALAISRSPFQVHSIQVLTAPLEGLPRPQLVLAGRPMSFPSPGMSGYLDCRFVPYGMCRGKLPPQHFVISAMPCPQAQILKDFGRPEWCMCMTPWAQLPSPSRTI